MSSAAPTPDAQRLAEPMRSRWSPSVFDASHQLDDEQIAALLQAARWAPSWGNSQPWSFLLAPRGGTAHGHVVARLSRGNSGWVPRASLLVLGAVQVGVDEHGEEPKSADFGCYDLGQAVAHLTLQAQAMGLVTHQFAGYDREATARALAVPEHIRLMAGVAIGVRGDPAEVSERDAAREERSRERHPLTRSVHVERWGVPWPAEPRT